MKATEMVDQLLQLIDHHGNFEVVPQDITMEPDEETGIFEDIASVESVEYVELPIEGGVYPCILIKIQ